MKLTMNERRSVAKAMAARYRKATKREKGRMLDEFVELTGYNRWYAVRLLRGHGKAIQVSRRIRLVGDVCRSVKRPKCPVYDGSVVEALKKI